MNYALMDVVRGTCYKGSLQVQVTYSEALLGLAVDIAPYNLSRCRLVVRNVEHAHVTSS